MDTTEAPKPRRKRSSWSRLPPKEERATITLPIHYHVHRKCKLFAIISGELENIIFMDRLGHFLNSEEAHRNQVCETIPKQSASPRVSIILTQGLLSKFDEIASSGRWNHAELLTGALADFLLSVHDIQPFTPINREECIKALQ